jgi:hypothetical protein
VPRFFLSGLTQNPKNTPRITLIFRKILNRTHRVNSRQKVLICESPNLKDSVGVNPLSTAARGVSRCYIFFHQKWDKPKIFSGVLSRNCNTTHMKRFWFTFRIDPWWILTRTRCGWWRTRTILSPARTTPSPTVHLPVVTSIPWVIVPTRKFIVDFISNAVPFAALADPFVLDPSILKQSIYNIMNQFFDGIGVACIRCVNQ